MKVFIDYYNKFLEDFKNCDLTIEEQGYLLGSIGGDGWFNSPKKQRSAGITGNKQEPESMKYCLSLVNKLPHMKKYKGNFKKTKKNILVIEDNSLYKLCYMYGLSNTENKQIITPEIRALPLSAKCQFVAGAIDTDGTISSKGKELKIEQGDLNLEKLEMKKKWLEFIEEILNEIGVQTNIILRKETYKNKDYYRCCLRVLFKDKPYTTKILKENIHLHYLKKQRRLNELFKEDNYFIERTKRIKFDLEHTNKSQGQIAKENGIKHSTVYLYKNPNYYPKAFKEVLENIEKGVA